MRLSELLGRRVIDADGDDIGGIADVRLVQDGPLQGTTHAALRIDGLIIVEGRDTDLFGYERHVGPALLRWLVHRRLGSVHYLPWDDVDRIDAGAVHAHVPSGDLTALHEMPRY
jgi:sporulation protein YlmC with PRC-barrel domain